jgi:hypothetical protein
LNWLLAIGAIALFLVAWTVDSGRLALLAFGMLGLWAIVQGQHIVATRRDENTTSHEEGPARYETYVGAAAVLRGVAFMVLGAVMALFCLAAAFGQGDSLVSLVRARPGVLLAGAGLGLLAQGTSSVLGCIEQNRPSFEMFLSIFSRLGGLLLVVLGLGLVGVGVYEVLFPEHFDALFAMPDFGELPPARD